MANLIGNACALYYNTGSYGTPAYTQIETLVSDSLSLAMAAIDTTSKDSNNWMRNIAGVRTWSTDFEAHIDTGSTAQEKVIDDFLTSTQVLTKIEYKTSNSSKYSGDCLATDYTLTNAYNDSQKVSGTLLGDGALTQAAA
jgi:hypothetical protein